MKSSGKFCGNFENHSTEAFGPFAAFLTLWVTVLVLRPTTVAIVALTFAEYVIKVGSSRPGQMANFNSE